MKQVTSIKENFEFRRVYKRGKSSGDGIVVVYFFKNYKKEPRLGVTVSSKIGKACVRNKIRRRIKSAFHTALKDVKVGYDIVIVARTKAKDSDYTQIEKSIIKNLKKLNLLGD